MDKINTFKELMDEIAYDWGFCAKGLQKTTWNDEIAYSINKTFITQNLVTYKASSAELAPGVFEKLEVFYKLLED